MHIRGEPVTMGILSEYRELGEIERAISRSPNSGLTECTYGCGLNLEHCSKSQQLDTGYAYIYIGKRGQHQTPHRSLVVTSQPAA